MNYEFTPVERERLQNIDSTDEIAAYIGFPEVQAQIIIDARTKQVGAAATKTVVLALLYE